MCWLCSCHVLLQGCGACSTRLQHDEEPALRMCFILNSCDQLFAAPYLLPFFLEQALQQCVQSVSAFFMPSFLYTFQLRWQKKKPRTGARIKTKQKKLSDVSRWLVGWLVGGWVWYRELHIQQPQREKRNHTLRGEVRLCHSSGHCSEKIQSK